jgi:hypothetical protein
MGIMVRKLFSTALLWMSERVRDALMWPVNLIRDFPSRFRRLLATVRQGIVGVVTLLPQASYAARSDSLRSFSRGATGSLANWLHRFAVQLFDLIGGPEIAQFVMHLITNTTTLNDDELAHIVSVLGPENMRFNDVRVAEGGLLDLIFKLNGNLAFTTWRTVHFPRTSSNQRIGHTRANLAILVHELTHVYQYERVGSRYLGEAIYMLVKTRRDCYDYGFIQGLQQAAAAGKHYQEFNREQQAQIAQDYFTLQRRGVEVTAYEPFIAELRAGEL